MEAGADQQFGHHLGPGGRGDPTRLRLGSQVARDALERSCARRCSPIDPPPAIIEPQSNRHLQRGRTISRADLAAAMLRLLKDPDTVRTTVDVAY